MYAEFIKTPMVSLKWLPFELCLGLIGFCYCISGFYFDELDLARGGVI